MRWRVRTGYSVSVIYLLLANPTFRSICIGALLTFAGLAIRAAASGHLRKDKELACTGPYARTRNPLYFGSAFLAVGFAIAGWSWVAGALVVLYFAVFYYAVMRAEESDLRERFGAPFAEYAASVPLFFPSFIVSRSPSSSYASSIQISAPFSWAQYRKNREYKALIGTVGGVGILFLRMWIRTRFGF
jgi:hypothetical protein